MFSLLQCIDLVLLDKKSPTIMVWATNIFCWSHDSSGHMTGQARIQGETSEICLFQIFLK
jgi:hypothetical protein